MNRSVFLWTAPLLAGCGAAMSSTIVRATPSPEETVFACVVEQVKALGYNVSSIDKGDTRLIATQVDRSVHRSDPTFRRGLDQLDADAGGASEGSGTTLRVTAQSFIEYFTRRGPTLEERKASAGAREAAGTLLDRCAPEGEPGGSSP